MACIFCKSGDEDLLICSVCIQKLLFTDVEEIQRIYEIALEKCPEKANALLDFVGPLLQRQVNQRKLERPQMIRRAKCRAVRTN
jgi:hypothetical protein